jgi:hypothetical protein
VKCWQVKKTVNVYRGGFAVRCDQNVRIGSDQQLTARLYFPLVKALARLPIVVRAQLQTC